MYERHMVDVLLENQTLERLQSYLNRDRRLAATSLEVLNARWIHLMEAWAETANSRGRTDHREREDIEAELQLRKAQPPFHHVKEVFEQLQRASEQAYQEITGQSDRLAHADSEIEAAIEQK